MIAPGIYKITNNINGKCYVGSSKSPNGRFCAHKSSLRSNSHHSKDLQADWNLHGEAEFSFSVIEIVPNPEDLQVREIHWADLLCAITNGYNSRKISGRGGPSVLLDRNAPRRIVGTHITHAEAQRERRARRAAGESASIGSPIILNDPERVSLRLSGDVLSIAHRAGSGNVSAGIRDALRAWGEANPG